MYLLVVLLFVLGVAFFVYHKNKYFRDNNYPPGPVCLPFIGSIWALGTDSLHLHATLTQLSDKWGPVLRLQMGNTPFIVITDPEIIKETFNGINAPSILRYMTKTFIRISNGLSIIMSYEREDWKLARKIYLSLSRNIPGGVPIAQTISSELSKLINELDKYANQEVYLNPLFAFFTRNVFFQITQRRSWSFEEQTEEIKQYHESQARYLDYLTRPIDFFPELDFLRKKSSYECCKHSRVLLDHHQKLYDERRKDPLPPGGQPRDILDMHIKESEQNPNLTDEFLVINYRDLANGATFTTSDTLDWLVLFFCEHPDIQEKCHKEISTTLQGRDPTLEDQADLPYLDGAIKEIFRLRPAAPLAIPHVAERDCTIGGYKVDKGSVVVKNIYGIGNSEKFFENASVFDPERWIRNPNLSVNLLHFGYGPTICLGMQIAKQEVFLAAATLIQRYKFQHGSSSQVPDFIGEYKIVFNASKWNTVLLRR